VDLHARTQERIEDEGSWSAVSAAAMRLKVTKPPFPQIDETVEFQVLETGFLGAYWRDEELLSGVDSDLLTLLKPLGFNFEIIDSNFTMSLGDLFYFELAIVNGGLEVLVIAERSLLGDAVGLYGEQLVSCATRSFIAY